MASIFTDILEMKKNIEKLQKAIDVYEQQLLDLQTIISKLEGVWVSEAGQAFINDLRNKCKILELNIKILNRIVNVVQERKKLLLGLVENYHGNGHGGF